MRATIVMALMVVVLVAGCASIDVDKLAAVNQMFQESDDIAEAYVFGTVGAKVYEKVTFGAGDDIHFLAIYRKTNDDKLEGPPE